MFFFVMEVLFQITLNNEMSTVQVGRGEEMLTNDLLRLIKQSNKKA